LEKLFEANKRKKITNKKYFFTL